MPASPPCCPGCGAPAAPGAVRCAYCARTLALIACPACFATTFAGSRYCGSCGAPTARRAAGAPEVGPCPRCRTALAGVLLAETGLHECAGCHGVWLDAAAFERVCTERERRAALLQRPGGDRAAAGRLDAVRYLECPACRALMNRVNFARASGVIVDVCKAHGVWLDAGELPRLAAFIDGGGVDRARERERQQLAEERRQLQAARAGWSTEHHESWSAEVPRAASLMGDDDVLRLVRALLGDG